MTRLVLPSRWWLFASHLLVLALPWLAVALTGALAADLRSQTREELHHQGVLLAMWTARELEWARQTDPTAALDATSERLTSALVATKAQTLAGLRVVDATGRVVASSGEGVGADLSADPLVADALGGDVAAGTRPRGPTRASNAPLTGPSRRANVRVFVTVPIALDGDVVGAVVLSRTPREEVQAFAQMAPRLGWGILASLLVTATVAALSGWWFTRSLRSLARAAPDLARRPSDAQTLLAGPRASHVSEVAAAAAALTEMARRLDDRLDYIGQFASHVSHEFKTPLSTLRGTVELLRDDPDMPPEQRERFLVNAESEVDRLERLVTGLLALARAEQAGPVEDVDLDAVIDAVVARHPGTRRSGVAGTVRGDASQLEAAVENLVANAWRHGGAHPDVRVECAAGEIAVRDAGPGITPTNLDKVFDRFFTTDRSNGGTGLGLALTRAVARAHGGDVTVQSAPGDTRFTLRLGR
jgi:signal transduction histidine kinase